MTTESKTVTVRVKHRASRPHTVWVAPVGWEPDISGFKCGDGGEPLHENGGVWGSEAEGELAGIAATFADLGTNDAREGDEYEVKLADLCWLSSGDCCHAGPVQVSQ